MIHFYWSQDGFLYCLSVLATVRQINHRTSDLLVHSLYSDYVLTVKLLIIMYTYIIILIILIN